MTFMVISDGHNLSDDTTCSFTGPGDMNNISAGLDPSGPLNHAGPGRLRRNQRFYFQRRFRPLELQPCQAILLIPPQKTLTPAFHLTRTLRCFTLARRCSQTAFGKVACHGGKDGCQTDTGPLRAQCSTSRRVIICLHVRIW